MTSNVNRALGAVVRAERLERGYSEATLAQLAEVEQSEIEAIERGEGNVTYLMILKIADGLGVSPSDLMKRVEQQ